MKRFSVDFARRKEVQGFVSTLGDLTAIDLVESDPLDLDYLTFRGGP